MKKDGFVFLFFLSLFSIVPFISAAADFKAANSSETFSFAVFGDAHQEAIPQAYNNQSILPQIVSQINKLKPNFVINLGDTVASGSRSEDWAVFHNAMLPLNANAKPEGFPAFHLPTVGGHEYCGSTLRYGEIACTLLRNEFPFLNNLSGRLKNTQNYYSFIYNNSYFIVVNTYMPIYFGNGLGLDTSSSQYNWYSKAAQEAKDYPNTFIFAHDGPYYGTAKLCGSPYRSLKELGNLASFAGHNLIYFAGHEDYSYGYFDCEAGDGGCKKATYFVTAGAGGQGQSRNACTSDKYDYDVRARKVEGFFHFMRVGVSGKDLRITVFSPQGNILYDFFIINQQYVGTNVNEDIKKRLSCNFNFDCESALYENQFNCPSDCSSYRLNIACTESDWSCAWSSCIAGNKVRICNKINSECSGGAVHPATENQSCSANSCNYNYSNWGNCSAENISARALISSSPAGCSGTPELTQPCAYIPPLTACAEEDWALDLSPDECPAEGRQVYSWVKIANCEGGVFHNETLEINCSSSKPVCAIFGYSRWGDCSSSGLRARTVASSYPEGCEGGSPVLSETCNYASPSSSEPKSDNSAAQTQIKPSFFKKFKCRILNLFSSEGYKSCLNLL